MGGVGWGRDGVKVEVIGAGGIKRMKLQNFKLFFKNKFLLFGGWMRCGASLKNIFYKVSFLKYEENKLIREILFKTFKSIKHEKIFFKPNTTIILKLSLFVNVYTVLYIY